MADLNIDSDGLEAASTTLKDIDTPTFPTAARDTWYASAETSNAIDRWVDLWTKSLNNIVDFCSALATNIDTVMTTFDDTDATLTQAIT